MLRRLCVRLCHGAIGGVIGVVLVLAGNGLAQVTPAAPAPEEEARKKQMRYGEQLAQECLVCHRRDGQDKGIPGIVFMSEEDIVAALLLYKSGRRKDKVMTSVAAALEDSQMRAVALYISSLAKPEANLDTTPPADRQPPKPKPASR